MPAEMADKAVMEWGVQNKYHRRRFLRNLNTSFRPVVARQAGNGQMVNEEQDKAKTAGKENGEGSVQTAITREEHSSTAMCSLCEDESIAAHTCDQCGLLCYDCAASHLRMKKAFKNHLVAP